MMPSLFICHGSPMLAIERNDYTLFLRHLGQKLAPKTIVVFTAHWESEILAISYKDDVYETIYDFFGFPDELYTIQYPARGSTAIASMVEEKLHSRGIAVKRDEKRGLDHGSWVILRHMYPDADIPVVQLSVNPYLAPEEQFKIGRAVRELGNEGILVIGSGASVHNLRLIKWAQATPEPWAVEFDDWLVEVIENRDLDALFHYETQAPHARLAVPRAEHFVPLLIAMGSGAEEKRPSVINRSYQFGTLSHLCFEF